jgi:hypothetical protein
VNSPKNDDAQLLEAIPAPAAALRSGR